MSASKIVSLGCVVLAAAAAGCSPTSVEEDCEYYYGPDYPYCDYAYYDPYAVSGSYSALVDEEVDVDETPNPDPSVAPKAPDATVAVKRYTYLARDPKKTGEAPDLSAIDESYPCNQAHGEALALCASDGQKFVQSEDYIVIAFELEQPLPQHDDTNFFVVGFAFDRDDDTANNYTPPPGDANDYFGATDQWYTASYTPTDGWKFGARVWGGTAIQSTASTARIILERDSAALLVPVSEFGTATPPSRISLFRHTGDEGANGNWSGLVYPPLGMPLAKP
jgi:hypothetical protein